MQDDKESEFWWQDIGKNLALFFGYLQNILITIIVVGFIGLLVIKNINSQDGIAILFNVSTTWVYMLISIALMFLAFKVWEVKSLDEDVLIFFYSIPFIIGAIYYLFVVVKLMWNMA